MFDVHRVARELVAAGLRVQDVHASDDPLVEDDEIQLTRHFHVQVGATYLVLNECIYRDDGELHGVIDRGAYSDVPLLAGRIRELVPDAVFPTLRR